MTDVLTLASTATARPRFRRLKIVVLAPRADVGARIASAFADHDQFSLQLINTSGPVARNVARPDLIVVDADLSDLGAGPAVERLIAGDLNGAPILLFADALAPDAARRLMRIGAGEVLAPNTPPEDIVETAFKAAGARKNEASARLSAVFSPRGGVGVSTLAVELALALVRENRSSRVCLVDLNFQFGVCTSLLNVEPKFNANAGLEPERVDAQLLEAYLSQHASGLNVLAAPTNWRPVRVPADGVASLLDIAASHFDHIVIDLPHDLSAVSEAVIANADDLFVVTDLSVPGVQLLRSAVLDLASRMRSGGKPSIILNRVPRHGRGTSLTVEDARRLFKSDLQVIYEDSTVAAEAGERGESILQIAPESPLARDISVALKSAMPIGAVADTAQSRTSAFFKLMRIR